MKPTLQEQKPNKTVEVNISTSEEKIKNQSNVVIKRFIAVIVSLVLLCGVIFGAVYLGKRITSDNFKEYHGLVHREGGQTTEETWRVTNTETEFENDQVRVIYDFNTGLATFAFKQQQDSELTDCYVVSFNLKEMKTPEDVHKELKSTEFDIMETTTVWNQYEPTDVWLNGEALGDRSQSMCSGRDIYFFRSIEGEASEINKRDVDIMISFWGISFEIHIH